MHATPDRSLTGRRAALVALALIGALAAVPGTAAQDEQQRQQPQEQRVVRGDRISILSGDILVPADVHRRGSVVCVGGKVTIEGTVSGEVIVVLGSLEVTGSVEGAINTVLTDSKFDGGSVDRELINVLGRLELIDSVIDGELVSILGDFSAVGSDVSQQFILPGIGFGGGQQLLWMFRLVGLFIAFVIVVLLIALMPDRIRVIGEEAPFRYVSAFFVGILGYLGVLIVFTLLAATIVGIPLAIVGFWGLQWLGVAGIFHAIGRRLARTAGAEFSVLGSVLLVFTIYAILKLAPTPLGFWGLGISATLWLLFFFLIQLPAVGLVILTRFGTRPRALQPIVQAQAPAPVVQSPAVPERHEPPREADPDSKKYDS